MPKRLGRSTPRARRMRKDPTWAEFRLWRVLSGDQMGVHFRRQEPIGPYIADFACRSLRIVVETDGMSHWDETVTDRDDARDAWMAAHNWFVLRFADDDIQVDLDSVVRAIEAAVEERRSGW